MSELTCQAERKDGQPCRAPVLPGSRFCFAHDPARSKDAQAARAKGATNAAKVRSLKGRRLRLDTAGALVKFASGLMQDTLAGTIDPDTARVVFYGVSIQKSLIEVAELEAKVAELERLQARRGPA
jgi:hypothetical protein